MSLGCLSLEGRGRKKSGVCVQCSVFAEGFLVSVSLDSEWRLSPACTRSSGASDHQSCLVWGHFREPAVLQNQTPERGRGNANPSNWEFSINPKKRFEQPPEYLAGLIGKAFLL